MIKNVRNRDCMKTRYARDTHDAPRSHTLREKRNAMMCPYVETSPNVAQTVRFLGKRVPACVAADREYKKRNGVRNNGKENTKRFSRKAESSNNQTQSRHTCTVPSNLRQGGIRQEFACCCKCSMFRVRLLAADRNHQLHRLGLPIVCLQTLQNSCGWQKSATKRRRIDEPACTPTRIGGRTKMLTLGCPNARNEPFWFLRTKYSSKPNAMWSMILTHSFAGRAECD